MILIMRVLNFLFQKKNTAKLNKKSNICINSFLWNKAKNKNKKHFCKCCLQCFSSEKILIKLKENCLKINDKQDIKLKGGSTEFKHYFKQLVVSVKIYTDFECRFKEIKVSDKNNASCLKWLTFLMCKF